MSDPRDRERELEEALADLHWATIEGTALHYAAARKRIVDLFRFKEEKK